MRQHDFWLRWAELVRPADIVVLVAGSVAVVASAFLAWTPAQVAESVVVRAGGTLVDTLSLAQNQTLVVAGPLGVSRIEIRDQRVRIAADPSPRQHCVRQGWLARAGDMAMCLPNQVSVEILGRSFADTRTY